MLNIYIGADPRERSAYQVAADSLARNSSQPVALHRLDADDLYRWRMLWRPVERSVGRMIDHLSGATQSTAFATSRFLVPFLQRTGWALFVDCDIVCVDDIARLFALADQSKAVMVVKCIHRPIETTKMDGQAQLTYDRKNWSSVVLWNAEHPAHHRLSLADVNSMPGDRLHQFYWLRDDEIGALPDRWNWLCGVQPRPDSIGIAHYTMGGPWLASREPQDYDDVWHRAAEAAGVSL